MYQIYHEECNAVPAFERYLDRLGDELGMDELDMCLLAEALQVHDRKLLNLLLDARWRPMTTWPS